MHVVGWNLYPRLFLNIFEDDEVVHYFSTK
jgi:hypothetical protein